MQAFKIFVHSKFNKRRCNFGVNRGFFFKLLPLNVILTSAVNLSRNRRILILWLRSVRLGTDC